MVKKKEKKKKGKSAAAEKGISQYVVLSCHLSQSMSATKKQIWGYERLFKLKT